MPWPSSPWPPNSAFPPTPIREALAGFRGARRRFETRYRSARFHLVDDYGHHPTEIHATLAAARSLAPQRVLCLFQPHRYTRTQKLRDQFATAFDDADAVWIADVYPASEAPIPGVDGGTVATAVNAQPGQPHKAKFVPALAQSRLAFGNAIRPGDLVVTLGAGNVHECAAPLARDLATLDALIETSGEPDLFARLYEPMRKHTTLMVGGPAQIWLEPSTIAGFAAIVRYCRRHCHPAARRRPRLQPPRPRRRHSRRRHPSRRAANSPPSTPKEPPSAPEPACASRLWPGPPARPGSAASNGWRAFPAMSAAPAHERRGHGRANLRPGGVRARPQRRTANSEERPASSFHATYRDTPDLNDTFALAATFRGTPGTAVAAIDANCSTASREKRRKSQPVAASAGCFFKNPAACPPGKLIDELGLKGLRSGAAAVSGVHGNFIVNEGGATAHDFLALIGKIKRQRRHGTPHRPRNRSANPRRIRTLLLT